jgi:DNA ligase-1
MTYKQVFKVDSKGKMRFIGLSVEGSTIVQTSGLVGSDKSVINRSECVGKNIGRSNETTAEEQAVLEFNAKVKKKLEEGYYETEAEAMTGDLILPMLAKDFKKEEKKVKYPFYVQPKLDGMRSLKKRDELVSRTGKVITTMNHIAEDIPKFSNILDGELYAHGESFERNMELIKKYREGESEQVKYHVYDIIMDLPFDKRYAALNYLIDKEKPKNIELVPTFLVKNKEELLQKHNEFLEQGYEGTIIRWGDTGYEPNKRSGSLLKFKDFQDIACEIVDVKPSEKRPEHGSFICKLEDGRTFGCGMRFSHEERANILINKQDYIGKTGEIRFFEYSEDGIPRFPVCVGIRLDK